MAMWVSALALRTKGPALTGRPMLFAQRSARWPGMEPCRQSTSGHFSIPATKQPSSTISPRRRSETSIWPWPSPCWRRLGLIKADPGQIEQVIMNLVINARDAMPQGGKLVLKTANVSFEKESANHYPGVEPGSYVRLTVSD